MHTFGVTNKSKDLRSAYEYGHAEDISGFVSSLHIDLTIEARVIVSILDIQAFARRGHIATNPFTDGESSWKCSKCKADNICYYFAFADLTRKWVSKSSQLLLHLTNLGLLVQVTDGCPCLKVVSVLTPCKRIGTSCDETEKISNRHPSTEYWWLSIKWDEKNEDKEVTPLHVATVHCCRPSKVKGQPHPQTAKKLLLSVTLKLHVIIEVKRNVKISGDITSEQAEWFVKGCKRPHMRQGGIEPPSIAWKATMLTITPLTLQDDVLLSYFRHRIPRDGLEIASTDRRRMRGADLIGLWNNCSV